MGNATVHRRRVHRDEARRSADGFFLRPLLSVILVGAGLGSPPLAAQQSAVGPKPAWVIVPRISLTETLTDNGRLSASRGASGSEQITQITPGIRIQGESARLKGYLDYGLSQIYYAQHSSANKTQNSLNAFGTLEAVEDWLFLDAGGNISQASISAFGTQSSSNASINANSTETSSFRLSPYTRGRLSDFAEYLVRYTRSTTRSDGSTSTNTDSNQWSANLHGGVGFGGLSWSLDALRQDVQRSTGRNNESERLFGNLYWEPDRQWRYRVSAGRETNNFTSPDGETRTTHGYGLDWRPTDRTNVSAFRERRFFGDGHSFTMTHRTPRSSWRFSDTKDVSAMHQSGSTVVGTIYDLFLALIPPEITDPQVRAALAEAYIQRLGLSPDQRVFSDFLSSQATLSRRQDLSFALIGGNNTVTFTASQSRRQSLVDQSLALLDLNLSLARNIEQRGLNVNWSHKLSPLSSLSAGVSASTTSGQNGTAGNVRSTQKSLNVTYSTKLGAHTSASLGLRRTEFDSDTANNYSENSVTGAISAHF